MEKLNKLNNKNVFFIVCVVLLLISFYKIVYIVEDAIQTHLCFEELAESVKEETYVEKMMLGPSHTPSSTNKTSEILPQYQALYEENSDFAGWIQIEDTELNYPVMYTPDHPEYYLYRTFDHSDSMSGTPFIGEGSSLHPKSNNLIVYGHHMKNQTMFATLLEYQEEQFWREHPDIQFDTLFQTGTYEVMSVFFIDVTPNNGHFAFYDFIDLDTEAQYQEFLERCKQLSLYETGISATASDDFITLVTCSDYANGRFVVVAKEKSKI